MPSSFTEEVPASGPPLALEHHSDEGWKMPLEQMFYVSNGQCYLQKGKIRRNKMPA